MRNEIIAAAHSARSGLLYALIREPVQIHTLQLHSKH